MSATDQDPTAFSLDELRELRASLQSSDDAVSYVRRLTQARLDLVLDEQRRRRDGDSHLVHEQITQELAVILSSHLTAGGAGLPRPPRPADDFSEHPLAHELDELCAEVDADLTALSDDQLAEFAKSLQTFEHARSAERRQLFSRIDGLSAELVRRYRDGEASVDGLLAED